MRFVHGQGTSLSFPPRTEQHAQMALAPASTGGPPGAMCAKRAASHRGQRGFRTKTRISQAGSHAQQASHHLRAGVIVPRLSLEHPYNQQQRLFWPDGHLSYLTSPQLGVAT
jgi:hypothetical protein